MPTVITVPFAQRTKSIKFGAAYSPALSFNPDKNLFYARSGVLTGMGLSVATIPNPDEITVSPGTFIQRGIIVEITSAQVLQFPDPLPAAPLYLVAENANEVVTSNVTLQFTTAPAADSVIVAQWLNGPIVTTDYEEPQKISILEIVNTLDSIAQLVIKRHHVVATGGQTVFTVPLGNSYVLGANKMWVFRNGQKLEHFLDYNETTTTTVTLTFGATANDEIELVTFRSAPPITSIALNDLTDMTTDLAHAIKDTGALRANPATLANFLATIDDVTAAVSAASGPFVFAKYSALVGTLGFGGGPTTGIGGTSVPFTLTAMRPVKMTLSTGGLLKFDAAAAATVSIRVDGASLYQAGYIEGSDGGSTVLETSSAGATFIVSLAAGAHTVDAAISGAGTSYVLGPIQVIVETGEAIP